MQFKWNTCFPPGSLKFGSMPGNGCLCDWPPQKPLDPESLMSFPWWTTVYTCCQYMVPGELSMSCVALLEESSGSLCLVPSNFFPCTVLVPFANFSFYCFAILIYTHDYTKFWICESSRQILEPGVVLGLPETPILIALFTLFFENTGVYGKKHKIPSICSETPLLLCPSHNLWHEHFIELWIVSMLREQIPFSHVVNSPFRDCPSISAWWGCEPNFPKGWRVNRPLQYTLFPYFITNRCTLVWPLCL